jgi:peptide/nickel transport system substrate-binding protein
MTHAIDRKRMLRQVMTTGAGRIAHSPVDEGFWAYGGADRVRFDPAKSLDLLGSQGWRDTNDNGILNRSGREFQFELLFQKGSITSEKMVRIIKLNLNTIGVDVKPTPVELKELVQRMRIGAYDAALYTQPFESTPDDFYAVFHSESIPLGFNMLRYRNRQVDRSISFLYGITERARALPIYQQLQLLLSQDQPCTFLYFIDQQYIAFDPRFQNLGLPGASLNAPTSWYILTEPR